MKNHAADSEHALYAQNTSGCSSSQLKKQDGEAEQCARSVQLQSICRIRLKACINLNWYDLLQIGRLPTHNIFYFAVNYTVNIFLYRSYGGQLKSSSQIAHERHVQTIEFNSKNWNIMLTRDQRLLTYLIAIPKSRALKIWFAWKGKKAFIVTEDVNMVQYRSLVSHEPRVRFLYSYHNTFC